MERFDRYRSGDMPHSKVHRLWEAMSRQDKGLHELYDKHILSAEALYIRIISNMKCFCCW